MQVFTWKPETQPCIYAWRSFVKTDYIINRNLQTEAEVCIEAKYLKTNGIIALLFTSAN